MTPVELAAILAAAVVVASMLSVELGISVALLELVSFVGPSRGSVFDLSIDETLRVLSDPLPLTATMRP